MHVSLYALSFVCSTCFSSHFPSSMPLDSSSLLILLAFSARVLYVLYQTASYFSRFCKANLSFFSSSFSLSLLIISTIECEHFRKKKTERREKNNDQCSSRKEGLNGIVSHSISSFSPICLCVYIYIFRCLRRTS